jgi:hypothetical protein
MSGATLARALALLALKRPVYQKPTGNGLVVRNGDQLLGRSILCGPAISVDNPEGIGGAPHIKVNPGKTLLASLQGADLNSTADQAMTIEEIARYIVTDIWVTYRSATPANCAGGFYTAPNKTGYILVSATQVYSAMSDAGIILQCTLNTPLRMLTGPKIYFSLTTAEGSACTADILIWGHWLYSR